LRYKPSSPGLYAFPTDRSIRPDMQTLFQHLGITAPVIAA
jgi:hypothetical protein